MTDWTQQNWIPKKDLEAWHFYKDGDSENGYVKDYSGKERNLEGVHSPEPVLTQNAFKGRPAWYFDGTKLPMLWAGAVTMKHVFVLASFAEANFAAYRGLLTGASNNWILTGGVGTDEIYQHGGSTPLTYFKNGQSFAAGNFKAPMNGAFGVIEATVYGPSTAFNGIQVGQHGDDGAALHKGYWMDQLIFSTEQIGEARRLIYEYFATRYGAWQQNAAGLNVFPFQPNWQQDGSSDKLVLSSTTVSGHSKFRSKSLAKDAFQLNFENRTSEEYDAARLFWKEHYPGTPFVYRDDAFTPARDVVVKVVSAFPRRAAGYNDFSFSLQLVEV